jgi:hypothetical protein
MLEDHGTHGKSGRATNIINCFTIHSFTLSNNPSSLPFAKGRFYPSLEKRGEGRFSQKVLERHECEL